ncbi:MAG: threonylcarbamoyl-AMP synthase [Clostridia bacterium]|nr:threonylcarbamoyl-AMP synthase [Clostridia bacterium]
MKTEIIKISNPEAPEASLLEYPAQIIKSGGLVVFPTETVYGIGADATNENAVSAIFEAKGRPSDNPLIIHIETPEAAERYAYTSEVYYKLADSFMPGPLTVVLKSRESVPKKTRGGLETVAVRCPIAPIARELIRLSGTAIAAPSANLSGSPSPTTAEHVIKDMNGRVDAIIDGGAADFGLESTIVKIEDNGTLTLLRPGKITIEDLSQIAKVNVADAVTDKLKDGEVALSPGMKYRHYAPTAPLTLIDGEADEVIAYLADVSMDNVAIITYDEYVEEFKRAFPKADVYNFGKIDDKLMQAHSLFAILREIDSKNYSQIYAPLPEKKGIALALYNRMIRAAAHKIIRMRR